MCGIAGLYRFRGNDDDAARVRAMLSRLERRGPDDEGLEVVGPAVLGNRRLAILDLSAAGHQPMRSSSGRYWITFNGEIYNHDEVRRELGIERAALRSRSDTEILLLAWERWGVEALPRLVGQWAIALFDSTEQRLWLARDRFGEKPLFYHAGPEALVFASSLEALVQHPQVPRDLDPDCIAEYVTLRYVVSPRTVLRETKKLAGGTWLEAGRGGIREQRWFTPRFRPRRADTARARTALVEEFDGLLARASERCLVSDVPVGLLLSDGIDSHSIRESLARQGRTLPSYTFRLSGPARGTPPARVADSEIHDVVVSNAQRLSQLEPAFATLTEPVGDGAALATWMLIRRAREQATVFLCGHGGDEVLGGYRLSQDRFRLALLRSLAWLPERWMSRPIGRLMYGAETIGERHQRLRSAAAAAVPAAARYLIHRPLPAGDVALLLGNSAPPPPSYLASVDQLYAECAARASDLDRMQEVMLRTFLSENILSFADSVAMDSSAELRMPFLDRDLVQFVFELPPECRVSRWPGRANTKLMLRWWARNRLPRDVVTRRKRPFQFGGVSALLRHDGGAVRDRILSRAALRRALPGAEAWLSRPPESYRGPWEGTLWALLALGIWCERVGAR